MEDDLKWSRYNRLFESEKYGHLIYNSLTNSFAELNPETYREIEKIRDNPRDYDYSNKPGLFLQLLQAKIMVGAEEEKDLINVRRLHFNYQQYSTDNLYLTVAPTTNCNFKCPYCYEQIEKGQNMSLEIEEALLTFIQRFQPLSRLNIFWYGGEPLLKFDTITRITEKILDWDLSYHASMVTNGYLLNDHVISELDNLKIKLIQVKIDGNEDTHNSRRRLKNGKGSYHQILENLDRLMDSWDGFLQVRVNVDGSNTEEFVDVYQQINDRYNNNNKIKVYPGIIDDINETNPEVSCQINREEEIKFYLQLYQQYGIRVHKFYPQQENVGCIASARNAFLIGPVGEVYKCWDDVGDEEKIIGNIENRKSWNNRLLSRYIIGADLYEDERCQDCFYLPVCDGGCSKKRVVNRYEGKKQDHCLVFKDHLEEMLEIYYGIKHQKQSAVGG